MAAYPDGLPTRVDGSLGRTKSNARAVEDLSYEVPAEEFNILADSVEGIAATLGLPNAVGMPAALASLISSGKVFALQQISTNGVQIAESTTLVKILATDLYVVTSAQTAPSWRLIFGAYGLHLVPSDYGGAGVVTINGVADIVTFAEAGIYLLVGDGANAWTLTPATDYSAIDGAIASVQADATQALSDAAAANTLAQNAYNGLAGKLDVAGHTALSIPASTAGTLADVAASSNDTLFGRVAGAFGFFNVTLAMIAAAVKSAAQNVESLRQIYTSTPAPIGTAAAGSSVQAAAGDHVHAITDGTIAESKLGADLIGRLDPLYTFPSYGTVNGLFQGIGCTDFLFNSNGIAPFSVATSGTGSNVINIGTTSTGTRMGVIALSTGTDTTGRSGVGTTGTPMRAGVGRYRWRCDLRVTTASDGTDTFTLYAGFTDLFTGIGTCGAYVTYTHGTNSGNLVFTTRSASTSTSTNLATSPVSATAWTSVEIQIDQDLAHAYCYVNGSLVATHTTNIPVSTELFGAMANVVKSAGTTSRTVDLDLMGLRVTRAAAV